MQNLRRLCVTWNNWQDDFTDKESVGSYFENLPHFRGAIVGFEVGEQGTPHLQIVIQFTQQKTWKTLQKYFKKNHMEAVRSMGASITYCKKDGDYLELGDIALERARTDIEDFKGAVLEGRSILELFEDYPRETLAYHRAVASLQNELKAKNASNSKRDVSVFYLAGESGLGKTTIVYDSFGFDNVFRVTSYKHPFDGYRGQKVLFLDEFRQGLDYDMILNILDGWPMELTARNNNRWAEFDTVVISSNWEFCDQYTSHFREHQYDRAAFKRRFDFIEWGTASNWKKISKKFSKWADSRKNVVRKVDNETK